MNRIGHESGRMLFDGLEPSVRERTLAYIAELGINRDSIQQLRPWRAYYTIVRAFWSKRPSTHNQVDVDAVLGSMARAAGKRIDYELRGGGVHDVHGAHARQSAKPIHRMAAGFSGRLQEGTE